MGFQAGERIHREEILDAGTAAPDEVKRSLADLRRVNAWLGGQRVMRLLMREQLRRTNLTRCSILDAGTGSGDMAEYAAREFGAMVVGLDRVLLHLGDEKSRVWSPVAADMHALPFPPRSFDFVTANLVLHHFENDQAVKLLREMAAIARRAVLINDLERHALAWWFIKYSPFARSPVSRIDGAISVQNAFTVEELTALATRAGFTRFQVRKHIPFRLSLVIEV